MLRRTATLAAATLLAGGLSILPLPPAAAAPAPADDGYTVLAGGTYTLDPLANDETTPFSIGPLRLCGVVGLDRQKLHAQIVGDRLAVELVRGFSGRTRITYAACQGDERATATVTLQVVRLADVRARKVKGSKGRVVFANPNTVGLTVSWGSSTSGRPDARRVVPAQGRIVVSTKRSSLYWVAYAVHEGAVVTTGDGELRRLQRRR